ncbi:putative molybdenum carrier protein [Thermodesulfobacteriota bacterium B35]
MKDLETSDRAKETMKIVSGGQTGADRAALDAAIRLGIPHGGWLPRGRKTEDGPLPGRYRLREMDSGRYRDRTEKNILDSDGTLIVSLGPLTGGSALTEALAIRHDRPCLHINLELVDREQAATTIGRWLREHAIRTLNVAGPRASGEPRIYEEVLELLLSVSWPA